jgi:hypothetical protein
MKASYSSVPKIKLLSSDAKYFLALAVITTITISAYYFLKPKEKKQN